MQQQRCADTTSCQQADEEQQSRHNTAREHAWHSSQQAANMHRTFGDASGSACSAANDSRAAASAVTPPLLLPPLPSWPLLPLTLLASSLLLLASTTAGNNDSRACQYIECCRAAVCLDRNLVCVKFWRSCAQQTRQQTRVHEKKICKKCTKYAQKHANMHTRVSSALAEHLSMPQHAALPHLHRGHQLLRLLRQLPLLAVCCALILQHVNAAPHVRCQLLH